MESTATKKIKTVFISVGMLSVHRAHLKPLNLRLRQSF